MTATFDRVRAFDLIQAALHEYEAGDGFAVDSVVDALAACVVEGDVWQKRAVDEMYLRHAAEEKLARIEALCDRVDGPDVSPGSDETSDLVWRIRAILRGDS